MKLSPFEKIAEDLPSFTLPLNHRHNYMYMYLTILCYHIHYDMYNQYYRKHIRLHFCAEKLEYMCLL